MAYMCLKVRFAEAGRQRLLLIARILDAVLIGDFVVFIISGSEMFTTYVSPLSLIKDFDAFVLASLLSWSGFIGAFLHFVDIWVCWMNTYLGNRKTGAKVMLFFLILKLGLFVTLLAIGIVVFVQSAQIDTGLKTGFIPALSNYSKIPSIKENVDIMHQYFSCCGDQGYQDWFSLQWASDTYLPHNAPKLDQSVPFSCCDSSAMRPCISDKVHGPHPNYNKDKDKTIFTQGCRQSFTNSYNNFKTKRITIPWGTAVGVYLLHIIVVRYAQSSISGALEAGHPAFQGFGYLFACGIYAEQVKKNLPMEVRRRMAGKGMNQNILTARNLPLKHRLKMGENQERLKQKGLEMEKKKLLGARSQSFGTKQAGTSFQTQTRQSMNSTPYHSTPSLTAP